MFQHYAPATKIKILPGQYYDQETNLRYNYFRDYDPTTGRYIQSDPIGLSGGSNTYGYVLANPLRWTDEIGLEVSWKGAMKGFGGTVGIGGEGYLYEFTSECKCHKQITVKGFALIFTLGAGVKFPFLRDVSVTIGNTQLFTPFDCPDGSDFNGPAFVSGFNAVTPIGGTIFASSVTLGFASTYQWESGPTFGAAVGPTFGLIGWSHIFNPPTEKCC